MTESHARYTRTAIALHWAIAALLILNCALGVIAANFVDTGARRQLLDAHKPLGILLLALIVVRVGWRLTHYPPALPRTLETWEAQGSKWSHRALYFLMLLLPLSGWLLTSFAPQPHPILLGHWQIPFLPVTRGGAAAQSAHATHVAAGFAIMALIVLHMLAVVHHARRGASVLPRMLLRTSRNVIEPNA